MGIVQAIVYGLIQGLTEFLPISSSGHLIFIPDLMGWDDPGAGFTAVIQLGTLLAVLIYFATDLKQVLSGWTRSLFDKETRKEQSAKLGWAIFLGTIPIVVVGLFFEDQINSAFRSSLLVAIMLLIVSLFMCLAEALGKRKRTLESATLFDGIVIGACQAVALLPGASRSGSTIAGGLFLGLDREAAARFSFLLSVPSIFSAGVYELYQQRHEILGGGLVPTIIATLVAFISGYAAIAFLINFLKRHSTGVFIVYRVMLAALIIYLANTGRIAG